MSKDPRLSIEKGDRSIYTDLESKAPLKDLSHTEVFCLAMALGFKNGLRTKINSKDGLIRYGTPKEKHWRLIRAVAVASSKDLGIAANIDDCVAIVEEYANAGLQLLDETVRSTKTDELETIVERAIMDVYGEITESEDLD
ncbi:MAG: hypothetical protein ACFFER_04420 [Candidatus Thorarchaeota archaeon]